MARSTQRKLEYAKEYYERNKERILERRRERWQNADDRMKERQREWSKEYYYRNAEKSNAKAVEWMRNNKELVNARERLRRYKKQNKTELIEREEKLIAELVATRQNKRVELDE
jgi:hypothetical protein